MSARSIQLVIHYDGADFAGWQRQPAARTVQGELEAALHRLCNTPVPASGAGRTDAGVHARGLSVGVRVAHRWTPESLLRALNAVLPNDIWVAQAYDMHPEFHARFSALSRHYSYHLGLDAEASSPFRRRYEWHYRRPVDRPLLEEAAALVLGDHCFIGFAVQGTAPDTDSHHCNVTRAEWSGDGPRLRLDLEANRFLHHMVRFLVGTMLDVASGRRTLGSMASLLTAGDNSRVSPPAPPHALFLEGVNYPDNLYISRR